jgi:hypothetical protein
MTAWGFSVHTGWAALTAVHGSVHSVRVVHRARIDMIRGSDPENPPFIYHAAGGVGRPPVGGGLCGFARAARDQARTALQELLTVHGVVVGGGLIAGNKPLEASLDAILASHALIHAAEGVLFRTAIREACEALQVPVIDVRSADLRNAAARTLGVAERELDAHLVVVGKAAGKPWAKDQKDAYLAALLAL